jgi:hypothetical protein
LPVSYKNPISGNRCRDCASALNDFKGDFSVPEIRGPAERAWLCLMLHRLFSSGVTHPRIRTVDDDITLKARMPWFPYVDFQSNVNDSIKRQYYGFSFFASLISFANGMLQLFSEGLSSLFFSKPECSKRRFQINNMFPL